ncbi:MAG: Multi-sensor signal transduction histidine kinase [Pedosphaera sp.]|nr:Multi-sensor signal transduction histidine kinase [Pedosphaera sp.]
MDKPLRILILEDSEDDAVFVLRELRRAGYAPQSLRVDTEKDFLSGLSQQEWDVITADYSMPKFNALDALRLLQESGIDLPFIIVSGAIGEEVAIAAMKAGAHDYILKSSLARLVPAIERALRDVQELHQRREAEEAYLRLAAIVESSGDAIIGKNLDGTITNWNRGAERLFGYTAEEIIGRPITVVMSPEYVDEEAALLEQLKQGERIEPFETVRVRKGGQAIHVSMTISPIRDARGKIVGASKIARDITERKRAESYVVALSKLGQKLSSVSTPVGAARLIGELADELFGWDAFTLDLYDAETGEIHTALNVDTVQGQKQDVPSTYKENKPSEIARKIIEKGAELILRENANESSLTGSIVFGDATRLSASLMFVPIRNQAKVNGILSIQSYQAKAYEPRDLEALQTMADYCGGALDRIRAREALAQSEERFRKLAESAPIGIFENDAEGRQTYSNARWTDISGLSFERSLGFGSIKALHPEDRAMVEQSWLRAAASGSNWTSEHRLLTHHGVRWVRVQAAAVLSYEGKRTGYVGTVEDITNSKRAADALRSAQERLQHLVSSSPAVLYSLKTYGEVLLPNWVSESIMQMTGYGPKETLSSQWWAENLRLKEGPEALTPDSVSASESRLVDEYAFRRKDGTEVWIRDEKRLLRDASGKLVEVVGSWSDITERKRAEEELHNSREQLRALAAHLQSVREEERKTITREIHDELGQSLTGFKMDLAWMRNRLQSEKNMEGQPALLEKITTMGKLIDGTANLVRKLCTELRPGVLDDLGLVAAIEWQMREYQERTGIRCEAKLEMEGVTVDPDRSTALFRIFQEILTNVARHAKASRLDISMKNMGTHVLMEVRDDGKGISEQEKAGKKSLGLLGMRERALVLGGAVEIAGKPGKGTTVSVKVPLAESMVVSAAKGEVVAIRQEEGQRGESQLNKTKAKL